MPAVSPFLAFCLSLYMTKAQGKRFRHRGRNKQIDRMRAVVDRYLRVYKAEKEWLLKTAIKQAFELCPALEAVHLWPTSIQGDFSVTVTVSLAGGLEISGADYDEETRSVKAEDVTTAVYGEPFVGADLPPGTVFALATMVDAGWHSLDTSDFELLFKSLAHHDLEDLEHADITLTFKRGEEINL